MSIEPDFGAVDDFVACRPYPPVFLRKNIIPCGLAVDLAQEPESMGLSLTVCGTFPACIAEVSVIVSLCKNKGFCIRGLNSVIRSVAR